MKNAIRIYRMLLKVYPHSFRNAFGAQMLQTFVDHYQDVESSAGGVSIQFWLALLTDEIPNIATEHSAWLLARYPFLKFTISKFVLAALLSIPLYVLFYASLVNIALALPHPPMEGIAVVIAMLHLLLLPGALSMVVSYVLASAFIGVLRMRKVRVQ